MKLMDFLQKLKADIKAKVKQWQQAEKAGAKVVVTIKHSSGKSRTGTFTVKELRKGMAESKTNLSTIYAQLLQIALEKPKVAMSGRIMLVKGKVKIGLPSD